MQPQRDLGDPRRGRHGPRHHLHRLHPRCDDGGRHDRGPLLSLLEEERTVTRSDRSEKDAQCHCKN